MRSDKEQAFTLRKSGKSYNEIRAALNIPKATLSDWFSEVGWSKEIKGRLAAEVTRESTIRIIKLDKVRGQHLDRIYEEAREEAKHEFEALKYNPLFIAGLMLYWGEGDKATKCHVRMTNTDPGMLKLFYLFLQRICGADPKRISAHVLVYPDLNEKKTREYWASHTGLPLHRFTKSTLIQGRHPTKRLGYGVCMINVSSTYLKVKMLEWLQLAGPELISQTYYENIGQF